MKPINTNNFTGLPSFGLFGGVSTLTTGADMMAASGPGILEPEGGPPEQEGDLFTMHHPRAGGELLSSSETPAFAGMTSVGGVPPQIKRLKNPAAPQITAGTMGGGGDRIVGPADFGAGFKPDEKEILVRAVKILQEGCGRRRAGSRPTRAEIMAAVKKAYRELNPNDTGQWLSYVLRKLETLADKFNAWLDDTKAADFCILGTKGAVQQAAYQKAGRKSRPTVKVNPDAIRQEALAAIELAREIRMTADMIPAYYVNVFVIPAGEIAPDELAKGAERFAVHIQEMLGRVDDPVVAQKIQDNIKRIHEIGDEVRYTFLNSLPKFDNSEVERFFGFIRGDVEIWMSELSEKERELEGLLREFLHTYIDLWLIENTGSAIPTRLGMSLRALSDAILKTTYEINYTLDMEKFTNRATALIEFIVFREALRDRTAVPSVSDTSGFNTPPLVRAVTSVAELKARVGERIFNDYERFYTSIMDGSLDSANGLSEAERRGLALRFREAFVYLVRYGIGNYGDNYNEEHIRRHGLEPRLVRGIFRSRDANVYTDRVLELLRQFFIECLGFVNTPPLSELKPMYLHRKYESSRAEKFVPYHGTGMGAFVSEMTFLRTGKEFEDEFRKAVGITWAAFKSWGDFQPKPDIMPQYIRRTFLEDILTPDEREEFRLRHPEQQSGDTITDSEWECYKRFCVENGYPEDVTVSPTSMTSYLAVLKAYRFLSEKAAEAGLYIDPIDFVSAISPVIRRMAASANNGLILLEIPSFMREIPFRNIGQPTLTQQMKALGIMSGEVADSTLDSHASGRTQNPRYDTLRKNARALAQASRGGANTERNLYNLQVVFRYAFLLENFAPIFDPLGERLSLAAEDIPTRFRLMLVSDAAEYHGGANRNLHAKQSIVIKVRSGWYDRLFDVMRSHVYGIARLGFDVSLARPDGSAVTIEELMEKLSMLESQHILDSTLIKTSASGASMNDIDVAFNHYRALEDFAQDVFFFTRAIGKADIGGRTIHFEVAPRIGGYIFDSASRGRVTLFLNDIESIAGREAWSNERKAALVQLRLMVHQLLLEGELERWEAMSVKILSTAVAESGIFSGDELGQAVKDFLRLEEEAVYAKLWDYKGDVVRVAKIQGKGSLAPVLPSRSSLWPDQFRKFAASRRIGRKKTLLLSSAIQEYFETVKGISVILFANTLRKIISARMSEGSPAEVDELHRLAADFLRTLGIRPLEEGQRGRLDDSHKKPSIEKLSITALNNYAILFRADETLDEALPVDEELLRDLSNLLCIEFDELEVTAVFEGARRQLLKYNRVRRPSLITADNVNAVLPLKGQLKQTLDGERRKRLKTGWRSLVNDPEVGFAAFVRKRYRAPYLSDSGLLTLAEEYGLRILTSDDEVDIIGLSLGVVGESFAPYKNISEKMAGFYRRLLSEYLRHTRAVIEADVELVQLAIEDALKKDIGDIYTREKFKSTVLGLLGYTPERFDEFSMRYEALQAIFGSTIENLGSLIDSTFMKSVTSRYGRFIREMEASATEFDKKALVVENYAAEVMAFSLSLYLPSNISSMDKDSVDAASARVKEGLAILSGMKKGLALVSAEMDELESIAITLSYGIIPELSDDARLEVAQGIRTRFASAAASISRWEKELESAKAALNERLKRIREDKEYASRMSRIEEVIDRVDASVAEISRLVHLAATVRPSIDALIQYTAAAEFDISSFRAFRESADEHRSYIYQEKARLMNMIDRLVSGLEEEKKKTDAGELERLTHSLKEDDRLAAETTLYAFRTAEETAGKTIAVLAGLMVELEKLAEAFDKKVGEKAESLPAVTTPVFPEGEDLSHFEIFSTPINGRSYTFIRGEPKGLDISWFKRMEQMYDDLIVITTEHGTYLVLQEDVKNMSAVDIFGNVFELKFPTRSASVRDVPQFHRLISRIQELVKMKCFEGLLALYMMERRKRNQSLFNSFIGTLTRSDLMPHEAVRRWAMTHASELKALLKNRFYTFFTEAASAVERSSGLAKRWEEKHGSEYTTERHKSMHNESENLLENLPWAQLYIHRHDGTEKLTVSLSDYFEFIKRKQDTVTVMKTGGQMVSENFADLLAAYIEVEFESDSGSKELFVVQKDSGIEDRIRRGETIRVFDRGARSWRELDVAREYQNPPVFRVKPVSLNNITTASSAAFSMNQILGFRLLYELTRREKYRPLAWLLQEHLAHRLPPDVSAYIDGMLPKSADSVLPPNFGYDDLQEEALRAYFEGPPATPDTEMVERYPETGFVWSWLGRRKFDMLDAETDNPFVSLWRRLPELGNLFIILEMAQRQGIFSSHLISGLQTLDGDEAKAELLRIYGGMREGIIKGLKSRESGDIYSFWQRITGLVEPWKHDTRLGWRAYMPKERIEAIVPELGLIRPEAMESLMVLIEGMTPNQALAARKVIKDHPELTAAILTNLLIPRSEDAASMLGAFYTETWDVMERGGDYFTEEWIDRFVHLHTDAAYVSMLRGVLRSRLTAVKSGGFILEGSNMPNVGREINELFGLIFSQLGRPGQTVAEILTGVKTPWLPEVNTEKNLMATALTALKKMAGEEPSVGRIMMVAENLSPTTKSNLLNLYRLMGHRSSSTPKAVKESVDGFIHFTSDFPELAGLAMMDSFSTIAGGKMASMFYLDYERARLSGIDRYEWMMRFIRKRLADPEYVAAMNRQLSARIIVKSEKGKRVFDFDDNMDISYDTRRAVAEHLVVAFGAKPGQAVEEILTAK